ncbi:MAG: hypothetical protein QM704_10915 [Anaeromyxobacteraceae bacterium]
MSELTQDSLDYTLVVAEYFLALRGSGLLLSPLDQELVAEWERRGIPVAIVCRGIRHGLERLAEEGQARPPRTLRAVRGAVEDEWRTYRHGRVGDQPGPPGEAEAAARRLEAARARLADASRDAPEALRDAYRTAWRALETVEAFSGTPLERVAAAISAADGRLLAGWLRGLPRPERAGLGARVRLLGGSRPRGTSRLAHKEALRAHLLDLALEAGLTPLRGSV